MPWHKTHDSKLRRPKPWNASSWWQLKQFEPLEISVSGSYAMNTAAAAFDYPSSCALATSNRTRSPTPASSARSRAASIEPVW